MDHKFACFILFAVATKFNKDFDAYILTECDILVKAILRLFQSIKSKMCPNFNLSCKYELASRNMTVDSILLEENKVFPKCLGTIVGVVK